MTTRISMIPNNDVQVIHASQGDTEREWEFELYDNEGLIDTSSIGQQTVYPVYAGGTEEVLPVNTATPSTSPMLADIQYPDQLRLEQYFTYRQCPTASDGKAKVKKMYGNSIVWNQQMSQSYSLTYTSSSGSQSNVLGKENVIKGHKYILLWSQSTTLTSANRNTPDYLYNDGSQNKIVYESALANHNLSGGRHSWLFTAPTDNVNSWLEFYYWVHTPSADVTMNNFMLIDLTQMGLDSLTAQEFEALFTLPYYQYNQGTLLAFNGTDIKTTGKNLINADESYTFNPTISPIPVYLEANKAYTVSYEVNVAGLSLDTQFRTADNSRTIVDKPRDTVTGQRMFVTMTPTEPVYGLRFYVNGQITVSNVQIELGSTATSYEPYEEHLTPLPISDYFPTGMKSAGTVYDELSESSAVTRIGTRAYQAGDESDPTVITDKTTTYYPLDNPQTVSFVSASFVSQNIETEMAAENGKLYAKSDGYTENAGVFPCKIKVASDGVAYSSEFKLHVERKP